MLGRVLRSLPFFRKRSLLDFNRAYALYQQGALDAAERACLSLSSAPELRGAVPYLQGLIAAQRGAAERAGALFALAIEAQPDPTYRLALAGSLGARGADAEALRQLELAWESLPADDPRRYSAARDAARLLYAGKDLAGAERWYRRALAQRPDDVVALDGLSESLYDQFRESEALEVAERRIVVRRDTGRVIRAALMTIASLSESEQQIESTRAELDARLDRILEDRLPQMVDPVREVGLLPFYLAYHGLNDRALMMKLSRVIRASYATETGVARRPQQRSKLRIGFVSTFFYSHSVGRTTLGWIRDLPRERFEVCVFAIAPTEDAVAGQIRAAADRYVMLGDATNLTEARKAIDAAELDVLVFTDIGMHPLTYFLAHWRLAPIQVNTWGHPVTSGIDTLDYFFSSQDLDTAASEGHYSEALLCGRSYFLPAYERPTLAGGAKSRTELGLPAGRLYLCPQNLFKLLPAFDLALREILERDPLGRLVLFEAKMPALSASLRQRLAGSLGENATRVHFAPRSSHGDFLQILAAADVVLDPFGFSGANTHAEALAMGVPIVTLPSEYLRGRFAFALCSEIGMDDFIATDPDDYVRRALAFAQDPDLRLRVKRDLSERAGALFERNDAALALGETLLGIAETGP